MIELIDSFSLAAVAEAACTSTGWQSSSPSS